MEPLELPEPTSTSEPAVRLLTEDEVGSLADRLTRLGCGLPDPAASFAVGTVDSLDGRVKSYLIVQLRVHAEPMEIEPGEEYIFRSLVNRAEEVIQQRLQGAVEVFLFAPAGKVSRLAEVAGLQQLPFCIYAKTVDCIGPIEHTVIHADENGTFKASEVFSSNSSDPEEVAELSAQMELFDSVTVDVVSLEEAVNAL